MLIMMLKWSHATDITNMGQITVYNISCYSPTLHVARTLQDHAGVCIKLVCSAAYNSLGNNTLEGMH